MEGHKITDTREALKFMFAGKSIFTFINTKTENRFTYKIKSAKDSNLFFVSVLTTNSDSEHRELSSYDYIGTCVEGNYKHGKKSLVSSDAQSVRVFEFMLDKLKSDSLSDFLEVWHEGFCGKCGRRLTVPSSILTGIGPDCFKKLSKADKRDKFLELILS
jgi:hypothetical protein